MASRSFGGSESSAARTWSSKVTRSVSRPRAPRGEEADREDAEDDPADVREVGDAAALLRAQKGEPADQGLHDEVDAEEEAGREREDEDREDQRQHAALREEDEVGAEYRGDRPAGAEIRDRRIDWAAEAEGHRRLCRHREHASEDVEDDEPRPPERVLDVVPEDPEEEHVPQQVEPVRVQEHGREEGDERALAAGRARALHLAGPEREVVEGGEEALAVAGSLVEDEDEDVRGDQGHGDDRKAPRREVVPEREHAVARLLDDERHQGLLGVQAVLRLVPDG